MTTIEIWYRLEHDGWWATSPDLTDFTAHGPTYPHTENLVNQMCERHYPDANVTHCRLRTDGTVTVSFTTEDTPT